MTQISGKDPFHFLTFVVVISDYFCSFSSHSFSVFVPEGANKMVTNAR